MAGERLRWYGEGEEGYPGTHKLSDMTQIHCATERKRGGRERVDSAVQHYSVGAQCNKIKAAKRNKSINRPYVYLSLHVFTFTTKIHAYMLKSMYNYLYASSVHQFLPGLRMEDVLAFSTAPF